MEEGRLDGLVIWVSNSWFRPGSRSRGHGIDPCTGPRASESLLEMLSPSSSALLAVRMRSLYIKIILYVYSIYMEENVKIHKNAPYGFMTLS